MKLKNTIKKHIEWLYNDHLESSLIKHKVLIDQALEISEAYPELFQCELMSRLPTRYRFTIKRLGFIVNLCIVTGKH